MRYLTNIDLNKNELQNAVIQPVATLPNTGKAGQICFLAPTDESGNIIAAEAAMYQHNGTEWKQVGMVYSKEEVDGKVITGLSADGTVTTASIADVEIENDKTLATKLSEIETAANATETITTLEITDSTTDTTKLATIQNPKKNDMAIIKRLLTSGKYSHTAYVYNGTAWEAMDGNYDASNVYLTTDILLAGNYTSVGNINKTNASTSKDAGWEGMSIAGILENIFTKDQDPTINVPTISLTATGSKTAEVGTTYSLPTATLKITSAGTYGYGSATKDENGNLTNKNKTATDAKVPFTVASVECSTTGESNAATSVLEKNGTVTLTVKKNTAKEEVIDTSELIIGDTATTYNFSAEATYPGFPATGYTYADIEGRNVYYPLTNLQKEYTGNNSNYNTIKTGTTLTKTTSATMTGWRNYWYGYVKTAYDNNTQNIIARDSTTNVVTFNGTALTAGGSAVASGYLPGCSATAGKTAADDDAAFVILVPHSANKSISKIVSLGVLDTTLPSDAYKKYESTDIKINGYNGYTVTDGKDQYDILMYHPASIKGLNLTIQLS